MSSAANEGVPEEMLVFYSVAYMTETTCLIALRISSPTQPYKLVPIRRSILMPQRNVAWPRSMHSGIL